MRRRRPRSRSVLARGGRSRAASGAPKVVADDDSGATASPSRSLLASVRRPRPAKTARMSMTVTIVGAGGTATSRSTAEGVDRLRDRRRRSSTMHVRRLAGGSARRRRDRRDAHRRRRRVRELRRGDVAAHAAARRGSRSTRQRSVAPHGVAARASGRADPTQFLAYLETVSTDVDEGRLRDDRAASTRRTTTPSIDLGEGGRPSARRPGRARRRRRR